MEKFSSAENLNFVLTRNLDLNVFPVARFKVQLKFISLLLHMGRPPVK